MGPLFAEFSLTLGLGHRTEALGPFFYWQEEPDGNTIAVPPLFSRTTMTATDHEEFDIAYPVLTYDRFGSEYRWQLFQLLSFSGMTDQAEVEARRFTLFPFYFQQRSTNAAKNYTALFPLLGRLEGRMFRSEIEFALWPVYLKSVRRASVSSVPDDPFEAMGYRFLSARRGETTTYNFLYPFFHLRYGDGLRGWQFWPLIGHEEKSVTQKTNDWGEAVSLSGHRHDFLLWPIWHNQHRKLGTGNSEHFQALLPFYSFLRSPGRDSTSYLWPLGVTITDDRARNYREVDAPWPFVVFARGEGKTANRIWPLFGYAGTTNLESRFYLWPVYKQNRIHGTSLERIRTRILFFLYSDIVERNTETGKQKTRQDFWPLFTHRKDFDGSSRLQILSVLEPILPQSKSIERNYSPLWALWRSERHPGTESTSQSLLWNLYRRETRAGSKKCSLLFGLFQYQSSPETKRVRIGFIPIGKSAKPADGSSN